MDEEQLIIASYPFLRVAKERLASSGINFQELLEGDLFLSAREIGVMRVEQAIEERKLPEPVISTERDALFELLSYILGRVMVASMGVDSLTKLYALTEATAYQKRLESESDRGFLLEVFNELGMEARQHSREGIVGHILEPGDSEKDETEFQIPFNRYLNYTRRIKDPHWKLINQPMEKGEVLISRRRLVRLTRELLFDRFSKELTTMKTPAQFPPELAGEITRLKSRYLALKEELQSDELGEVDIQNTPPCMINILNLIQSGENVAHAGRFALTAFLHMIGLSNQEILNLNMSSPDFDEKIASYQVDHITGIISQTEYNPQSCKTMVNLGLCTGKNILCEKIIHPLGYYNAMNEGHKSASIRRKRLLDFLWAYFPAKKSNDLDVFLQGRGSLREHLETVVRASPIFSANTPGSKGTSGDREKKKNEQGETVQIQSVTSVAAMAPGRWYRLQLALKPFGKKEYGFIRTLKVRKGGAEHYILYAEFQGREASGTGVWLLPVMDMAIALPLIVAKESKQELICCVLPFLGKRYLFIRSLENDAQSSTDNKKEKENGKEETHSASSA